MGTQFRMLVIGIVGGVASGKSTVAGHLEQLGASVVNADQLGHEVLNQPDVRQAILLRWGASVFRNEGGIDRSSVARIVFDDSDDGRRELAFLEELTHPHIENLLAKEIQKHRESKRTSVLVLDAAVLLKAGWDTCCDKIVFVDAPHEVRLERCRERGWSEREFEAREAAQLPLDLKRARADEIIDNSSVEQARIEIETLWSSLDI